jgi:hypothetical protein
MPRFIHRCVLGKINRKIEGLVKGRHLVAKKSVFWPCYRVILIMKDGKEDPNKVSTQNKKDKRCKDIFFIRVPLTRD